jgi:predicted CXXCH cytochrome family protein
MRPPSRQRCPPDLRRQPAPPDRPRGEGLTWLLPLLLALLVLGAPATPALAQDFVGSAACAGCHQTQFDAWQQSHHRRAMAEATAESVLGDFADARFDYFGVVSRFYRRDGQFYVETDAANGTLQEFRIAYTFGFFPLQQYLVAFPDGRLQALSVSWDSRPASEGGQRWFHLYPDQQITANDPLHWTGAFQNWNSRCASCHSTDLAKGYDAVNDRYDTTFAELTVGCEACHGAGAAHLAWAAGDRRSGDRGFRTALATVWRPDEGKLAIPPTPAVALSGQSQVCFSCHALRTELQQREVDGDFFDNFAPAPLQQGFYHPDGQLLGEAYEFGSFLQSRMHRNQVSCGNCHDAHSGALLQPGPALCLQCHAEATYQTAQHLLHPVGSAGAECVNCHMTQTTFMGVDARRDHSFRVPDPQASLDVGVPNACTTCHRDRDAVWAVEVLTARGVARGPRYSHTAPLAAARAGLASAAPDLLALARNPDLPPILRGSALLESARFGSQQQLAAALEGLASPDPLLRLHAVGALTRLAPDQRLAYLQDAIDDPAGAVRQAVARQLIGLPASQWPLAQRPALTSLFDEYQRTLQFNADMPEAQSELGLFHFAQGRPADAEQAFLRARALAPRYLPAMLNLADLYRTRQRDDLAEPLLREALAEYPDSADTHHALGLLLARSRRMAAAVEPLRRASELAPDNAQYALVYGLALLETGARASALEVLEQAGRRFPDDARIASALRAYR